MFTTGLDTPHWTGEGNLHYEAGALGLNAHVRYTGSARLDNYAPAGLLQARRVPARAM